MPNFTDTGTPLACGLNAWSRLRNIKERIDFSTSQIFNLENNLIFCMSHPEKIDTSSTKENNHSKHPNSDMFSLEDISSILTKLSITRDEKIDSQKDEYFWSTIIEEIKKETQRSNHNY